MHRKFIIIFLLGFVFFAQKALAEVRKGLALVEIQNSRTVLELTCSVSVTAEQAVFVAIDEWGSEAFTAVFDGKHLKLIGRTGEAMLTNSPLKKALALPLTQEEFLAILRYEKPNDFLASAENGGEVWRKPKYKKLKILLQKFGTIQKRSVPHDIEIQYKKNRFHLKWLQAAKT